jgi:hypothetical protein
MPPQILRIVLLLVPLALVTASAAQNGGAGTFPTFVAEDLTGQPRSTDDWIEDPTFVIVVTHQRASDAARDWYEEAEARAPDVHRQMLISLRLPFMVGIETARSRARDRVSEENWTSTLLDRDGTMAEAIGLPAADLPVVFVLDGDGRVLAAAYGHPDDAEGADAIWAALEE